VICVLGGEGGVTSWAYLGNGAIIVPPDIDRGEEDTGGVEEGNGFGDIDGNIEFENPPINGPILEMLIEDGINNEFLLATAAAIAVSFAANMDR
jgi:hypothetical protein